MFYSKKFSRRCISFDAYTKKKKIAEKLHLVGNTHQSETESVKPSVAKIIELYTIQVRCLHFNRDFARIFNYHHAKIK